MSVGFLASCAMTTSSLYHDRVEYVSRIIFDTSVSKYSQYFRRYPCEKFEIQRKKWGHTQIFNEEDGNQKMKVDQMVWNQGGMKEE